MNQDVLLILQKLNLKDLKKVKRELDFLIFTNKSINFKGE
jgi:hypothetical protein